jgi:hypothetical protein
MARRTKEQKRVDDLIDQTCQTCMYGYQISIMDMKHLPAAGKKAAAAAGGGDAEIIAAIYEARGKYAKLA